MGNAKPLPLSAVAFASITISTACRLNKSFSLLGLLQIHSIGVWQNVLVLFFVVVVGLFWSLIPPTSSSNEDEDNATVGKRSLLHAISLAKKRDEYDANVKIASVDKMSKGDWSTN